MEIYECEIYFFSSISRKKKDCFVHVWKLHFLHPKTGKLMHVFTAESIFIGLENCILISQFTQAFTFPIHRYFHTGSNKYFSLHWNFPSLLLLPFWNRQKIYSSPFTLNIFIKAGNYFIPIALQPCKVDEVELVSEMHIYLFFRYRKYIKNKNNFWNAILLRGIIV